MSTIKGKNLFTQDSIRKRIEEGISEHEHQVKLIQWTRTVGHPLPGIHLLHAIPNGGHRGKRTAGHLQAEGVKAGVSDLFLPVARRDYHGLFIELKRIGGKKPTPAQVQFQKDVIAQGYCAQTCYGAEQAIALLCWYYGVSENWR